MLEIGQEWLLYTTPFRLAEVSSAPTGGEIIPNAVSIYAKDKSGTSALYLKDDAGSEREIAPPSTVTGTGASGRVAFWTSASVIGSDSLFVWDDTNNRLGLGIAAPTQPLHVRYETSDFVANFDQFNASFGMILGLRRAKGTISAPVALGVDEALGRISFSGHDGSNFGSQNAIIDALSAEAFTSTAKGTYLRFLTTAPTTTTVAEKMRLDQNGVLTVGGGATQVGAAAQGVVELHPVVGSAGQATYYALSFGSGNTSLFQGRLARGTSGSPSATQLDDCLVRFAGIGYGTSQYGAARAVGIDMLAAENFTNTAMGTYIKLMTTPTGGSVTVAERFRVGPAGQWGIGGATYGSSGDIFSSGGASAAPTWVTRATLNAALDHGTMGGLADDDHTQYALLAGRSGGQTIIGGTAAADDLILRATSGVGVGSETVQIQVGSNGAKTIATFLKTSGSTAELQLNSAEASKQFNLEFQDNGTNKWIIYKTTGNKFSIYDAVNNQDIMVFTPVNAFAAPDYAVKIAPTISTTTATAVGLYVNPAFTGSGEGPWGASLSGVFRPSASIGAAYNSLNIGVFGPPTGVTITTSVAAYYGCSYEAAAGAVTTGFNLFLNAPSFAGSLKPTTQYGLYVQNMGAAGETNGIGIRIDAQSGATNNYVFEFGNVDTTAAGAYYGRLPVLYNGLLKYIHVFSA